MDFWKQKKRKATCSFSASVQGFTFLVIIFSISELTPEVVAYYILSTCSLSTIVTVRKDTHGSTRDLKRFCMKIINHLKTKKKT